MNSNRKESVNKQVDHPDFFGTPHPVKTPINFQARKIEIQQNNRKAMRKLCLVSVVSIFFMTVQIIGGYLSNSIAIFTDTAHLASDLVGFAISILSLTIAQRPATKALSFGFHRAEVIGTLVSIIVIWGLTFVLLIEATKRIWQPQEIQGLIMLITAILGLGFNLIQMYILHQGDGHYHLGGGHDHHDHSHGHDHGHSSYKKSDNQKKIDLGPQTQSQSPELRGNSKGTRKLSNDIADSNKLEDLKEGLIDNENPYLSSLSKNKNQQQNQHNHQEHEHKDGHSHDHSHGKKLDFNINVQSAFLHVLGDMLMSVGVIIASIVIYIQPQYKIADPICTYLFSVIVVFTTVPVFKHCILVMMEGTPENIDVEALLMDLEEIEGVTEIHDFHVWSISVGKLSLSAHIQSNQPMKTLSKVTDLCRRKYKLYHTTIQMEGSPESKHAFVCDQDIHD